MAEGEDRQQPGKPRQTQWMRVMTEGQLTRDRTLCTREERERARAEARALAERRRQWQEKKRQS